MAKRGLSSMDLVKMDYIEVFAVNLALILAAVLVLWLISIRLKDVSIIDMAFSMILFSVALMSYWLAEGTPARQNLVLSLVFVWAARMTYHLVKRNWGHGEDVRYSKMRSWVKDDRAFVWLSLKKIFLLQGIMLWLVALPIQVAQISDQPATLSWVAWFGAAIALSGLIYETVADVQLTAFRFDPEKKGTVLNTGLWRYSRHPNYFGELSFWWGIFIIACEHPIGWFTIIGPFLYSYFIVNVTGQRTLDKKLSREKPDYAAYMKSTNGMIPMPPRKSS
jgi:steroid 5-alpha reductase family enzyme